MSLLFLASSLPQLSLPIRCHASSHNIPPRDACACCYRHLSISHSINSSASHQSFRKHRPSVSAVTPSNEGAIPVINFEDFVEKDFSFLDTDNSNTGEEKKKKTDRIISAGKIEETSKVLISIGSEGFVDQVVDSSSCQQLLVVHESLLTLACIKEKRDWVDCWQGELVYLPEKWIAFDIVFLSFFPALPFDLGQVLESLAKRCLPDARVVISHPEGREVLEQQRRQYPDVIVSNLPDRITLEKAATDKSFKVIEFVEESDFYLAVLKFQGN